MTTIVTAAVAALITLADALKLKRRHNLAGLEPNRDSGVRERHDLQDAVKAGGGRGLGARLASAAGDLRQTRGQRQGTQRKAGQGRQQEKRPPEIRRRRSRSRSRQRGLLVVDAKHAMPTREAPAAAAAAAAAYRAVDRSSLVKAADTGSLLALVKSQRQICRVVRARRHQRLARKRQPTHLQRRRRRRQRGLAARGARLVEWKAEQKTVRYGME